MPLTEASKVNWHTIPKSRSRLLRYSMPREVSSLLENECIPCWISVFLGGCFFQCRLNGVQQNHRGVLVVVCIGDVFQ